ncbi:MAG: Txe/YoeB family addiction module toxin [Flavobacteriales bacterium CG_4_10_14_0_8_um_filter_32_5]|nr:MAG: Txe/YoeB family addiction module toxin [Flavobacteriales bacterium CG_4_10_14_0_8_um_filter_32_5]
MEVAYNHKALEDLKYWKKSGNKKIQLKITALIEDIKLNPFSGIGKPEALKHQLAGKWSRRIDKEHRLVYAIQNQKIFIFSLKGHY